MGRPRPQLTPIPGQQQPEEPRVVKPELNLEQWAIFIPGQARGRDGETRVLERSETLVDGNTITDSVTVGYSQHGTLTAKDQRVLYALIQNWHERDCPLSYCYYSAYRIAQLLRLDDSGKNLADIIESLRRLHSVTITFKRCFHDAETNKRYKDEEPIHILSELKIRTREQLEGGDYEPRESEGYLAFHPRILKNLIRNYTRPVLFDTVLSLKDDTAQLLYTLVDRQIVGKQTFAKVTAELFRELGITGKDYHKPSVRKRRIEQSLKKLIGKQLSSGGFISRAEIVLTKDKSDYKVSFTRAASLKNVVVPKQEAPPAQKDRKVDAAAQAQPPGAPAPGAPTLSAEDELLVNRLRELGVVYPKAVQLVRDRRAATERELEAWPFRDKSAMKDRTGWLIRAIEKGDYSQPPKVVQKQAEHKAQALQKSRREVEEKYESEYVAAYLQPLRATLAEQHPEAAAVYAERCVNWDKHFSHRDQQEVDRWKLADLAAIARDHPEFGLLTFWRWLAQTHPAEYQAVAPEQPERRR